MELGSIDFAFDAERRQYGSIPVLDMLLRRCPADAAQIAGGDGARSVHPGAHLSSSDRRNWAAAWAWFPSPACGRNSMGSRPNREIFLERAYKEALHETGHTCSGWCTARNGSARCRSPPQSAEIDLKEDAFCAACGARLAASSQGTQV